MSTVTIINIDGSILKKSPEFIKSKTVFDILQSLFQTNDDDQYLLAIKTPAYMKILHSDSIPYNIYSDLINDNINIDSIPDYYLQILNNSEKGKFYFIFTPSSPDNSEIVFPLFTYGFIPSNYSDMPISKFISDLVDHFGISITQPKIIFKNKEIPPDQIFNIFFHNVSKYVKKSLFHPNGEKMKPIEFQFHIDSKGLKEIEFREIGLKEILDTEESYCLTLKTMNDYFAPLFKEHKILSEADHQALFGSIPQMIETSVFFSSEISKNLSYSNCIAPVFKNALFSFKQTSIDYFVNYNLKISPIITTLDKNPQIRKICDESPNNPGISFQSVVIQPIQRFPRYPLLLRELMKNTPESHPDYYFLPQVKEQVESMVHELADAHLVIKLNELKERLVESTDESTIFTPERFLVRPFSVHLKEKHKNIFSLFESEKSNLYLFNDIILLTTGSEKEIEQMRCDIDKFVFIPNFPDNLSITFYYNNDFKVIEFSALDQIQIFRTEFFDHRKKIFDSDEISILTSIKASEYFPVDDKIIHPMIDSSCCKSGNSIFAISKKNYHTYTTNDQSLSDVGSNKSIHNHSKLVIVDDNKYIFGGTKNVGPFEFFENKFVEAKPKNDSEKVELKLMEKLGASKIEHSKEGRIYHTCCSYDKYIVVFGGINPRNPKKEIFDMHFYSIETGEWFQNNKSQIKPEPRYKHSAVVYKDKMIIHGGISTVSNQLMKDTWIFDFLIGKWSLFEICDENDTNIVPRFGHAAVIVNNYMFVIGGSTLKTTNTNNSENESTTNNEITEISNESSNHKNKNKKKKKSKIHLFHINKVRNSNSTINNNNCELETTNLSSMSFSNEKFKKFDDVDDDNDYSFNDFENKIDDEGDDDDYSFDDFENDDDTDSTSSSFSSKNSTPAPDCFCLNLENGQTETVEIIGNFITGLSMFSAAFDELNGKIVVFGGRDPKKKMEKGVPIITLLDIPQYYLNKPQHIEKEKKHTIHKGLKKVHRRSNSMSRLKKSNRLNSKNIKNHDAFSDSDENEVEKTDGLKQKSDNDSPGFFKHKKHQNQSKKLVQSQIQLSSSDDNDDDDNNGILSYLKRRKIKTNANHHLFAIRRINQKQQNIEKPEKIEPIKKVQKHHNSKSDRNNSVNSKKNRKSNIKSKRRSSSIQNDNETRKHIFRKEKGNESQIDDILEKY